MDQVKNNYLGEERISSLLMKFSIPCILSLLVSALYNIVDQIFIGNSELGYLGNAATGIVFPILIIALAFAWCFGDGSAAYLNICQGEKNTQNAHKCVGSGITITLLTSIILVVVCSIFKERILRLFGASDATITMSIEYFSIVLAGLPVYIWMPLGNKRCSYATVIGQIVSFIISLVYFTRTKTFKLTLKSFIPKMKIFYRAMELGISTFITQMSIVVISLVCNMMLFKYGSMSIYGPDIPISVISIGTKVFTVVINIVVGIILGAQPILGYNYGAKRIDRVKRTYKLVLILTFAVGILSTLIFEICPEVVIGIFGKGDALYNEFAVLTFRVFLSLVTFTCTIKMTAIFFQAVGQPINAAVSSLTRDLVCFIPLVVVLPKFFGVRGILYAAPIADFIAMIVVVIMTARFFKVLNKEEVCIKAGKADECVVQD